MTTRRALRALSLTLISLAAFAGPASVCEAGEAHLYLAPYYYNTDFSGEGRLAGGSFGTDFDLEDTLGVDTGEKIAGFEGFVKFLGSRIEFGYSNSDYEGSTTLGSDLIIDGTTFSAGELTRTKVSFDHYKLMYGFDFNFKVVNVGFLVGAHVLDIEQKVVSSAGTLAQDDLRAPVPAVGVSLGVHPVSRMAIHGELTGFSATFSGVDVTLVDGFAGIDVYVIPNLGLSAGYRYLRIDATDDDEDNSFDLRQAGPYVGIALHL